MPSEQKWYALTGHVFDAKVEADGDIHIALVDANGNNAGTVSAEIPVGPKWCEIRQTVFGWTTQTFPFGVKTAHGLKIRQQDVITVTGKAFTISATRLPIIRTREARRKVTLHGRFIQ
jgi:hypothetical protein